MVHSLPMTKFKYGHAAKRFGVSCLLHFICLVSADCECGYTVNRTDSPDYALFTDLAETNFVTDPNIHDNTDWVPQRYFKPYHPSSGHYGRNAQPHNVVSNPVTDASSLTSPSLLGGDPGLQLWVRGGVPADGLVPTAEIRTARRDMRYGSFRAAMKITGVNGTCGAFFWYLDDTREIDIELLSRQMTSTSSFVNLVLHSPESNKHGHDASQTPTYILHPLPFRPQDGVHEYRFDWTPGKVSFFADGEWLSDMTTNVPALGSQILFSHWSDGRPGWSGGPPETDAVLTVSYFKAYFNSTDGTRVQDHLTRCKDPSKRGAICPIPELTAEEVSRSESNQMLETHFFTDQQDMSPNQTHYGWRDTSGNNKRDSSSSRVEGSLPIIHWTGLIMAYWILQPLLPAIPRIT